MEGENKLTGHTIQQTGIWLGLIGMIGWSLSLPFCMVQHTRFTGISLWVMLGGYLIALGGKLPFQKLSLSTRWVIFTYLAYAIFPLLDFWRWEFPGDSLDLVVLRLAMVLIPFLVSQFQAFWPSKWPKWILGALFTSLIINSLLTLSAGPVFIFDSIRNGVSIDPYYWMHRPYYGLYFGALIVGGITLFYKRPRLIPMLVFMILSGLAIVFLWTLLVKMAILGILFVMVIWALLRISSNLFPTQKKTVLFGIILITIGIVYKKSIHSGAYHQIRDKGQIDFATLNKNYANSFNLRLVLWQTAVTTTFEKKAALFGFGTANAQQHLNQAVCKTDAHLCRLKLDPHNVWLAEWMQHGLFGLILVSMLFLVPAWHFEENHFQPFMWIWLFVAFCCLSETYVNREMGVQTLVWLAVVLPHYVWLERKNILPEPVPT